MRRFTDRPMPRSKTPSYATDGTVLSYIEPYGRTAD